MEIVKERARSIRIIVKEPRSSLLNCRVARTFYERSVELCGVLAVSVEETSCSAKGDPLCEFRVTWE